MKPMLTYSCSAGAPGTFVGCSVARGLTGLVFALGACFAIAEQSPPNSPKDAASTPRISEPTALDVRATLEQLDRDRDGIISRQEAACMAPLQDAFPRLDSNHDGVLDELELKRAAVTPSPRQVR